MNKPRTWLFSSNPTQYFHNNTFHSNYLGSISTEKNVLSLWNEIDKLHSLVIYFIAEVISIKMSKRTRLILKIWDIKNKRICCSYINYIIYIFGVLCTRMTPEYLSIRYLYEIYLRYNLRLFVGPVHIFVLVFVRKKIRK